MSECAHGCQTAKYRLSFRFQGGHFWSKLGSERLGAPFGVKNYNGDRGFAVALCVAIAPFWVLRPLVCVFFQSSFRRFFEVCGAFSYAIFNFQPSFCSLILEKQARSRQALSPLLQARLAPLRKLRSPGTGKGARREPSSATSVAIWSSVIGNGMAKKFTNTTRMLIFGKSSSQIKSPYIHSLVENQNPCTRRMVETKARSHTSPCMKQGLLAGLEPLLASVASFCKGTRFLMFGTQLQPTRSKNWSSKEGASRNVPRPCQATGKMTSSTQSP